jgi:hypothetical protein
VLDASQRIAAPFFSFSFSSFLFLCRQRLPQQQRLASQLRAELSRLHREAQRMQVNSDPRFANDFVGSQSVVHAIVRHCRTAGLPPESFFVRKKKSSVLNLRNYSIGSQRAEALALALHALPFLMVRWHVARGTWHVARVWCADTYEHVLPCGC